VCVRACTCVCVGVGVGVGVYVCKCSCMNFCVDGEVRLWFGGRG